MIKLQTPVEIRPGKVRISRNDRITVLGSCFADNIGRRMQELGMDVCLNPFGTVYNPASMAEAVKRLGSGKPFGKEDCRMMGSGAGMVCSFSHHTSFARKTEEEFLENANRSLSEAADFFRESGKMILTLGTAWCYRHIGTGSIVSNCLKIDGKEFVRFRLAVGEIVRLLKEIAGSGEREIIFTISPIRHLRDGAHENQLSKAALLLAVDEICREFAFCDYFPAYEIMMDELRDYRFYAEDMVHPSVQAVEHIRELFCESVMSEQDREWLREAEKTARRMRHRDILAK